MARYLAALPGVLLLASCQSAVRVDIAGAPEAPVFELHRDIGGATAISGFSVGTDGRSNTIWSISSDHCIDVSNVVYGQAPPGFHEEAPAPRLEAGRNYDVAVTGCGASGGATFAIVGGQIVATRP